ERYIIGSLKLLLPDTPIILAYQSTDQGPESGLYMHRISNPQAGFPGRKYNPDEGKATVTQWQRSTYQFSAYVKNEVSSFHQPTADDILALARIALQSLHIITRLQDAGIGLERPSDIISPTRIDHEGRYAFAPNFTATFTHLLSVDLAQDFAHDINGEPRSV